MTGPQDRSSPDRESPDRAPLDRESLVDELRVLAEHDADALGALAARLAGLRSTLPEPSFDRAAIWAAIIAKGLAPGGDAPRRPKPDS